MQKEKKNYTILFVMIQKFYYKLKFIQNSIKKYHKNEDKTFIMQTETTSLNFKRNEKLLATCQNKSLHGFYILDGLTV